MDYKVTIDNFDGPMDLLLHLIKINDLDILNISVEEITKQYLDYIDKMEAMNLNIASEYLIMASELLEIKSLTLLPKKEEVVDEYEEDPKERLIQRLLEYQQYKELTSSFKKMETERKLIHTKMGENLVQYQGENASDLGDLSLDDLMKAFMKFMQRKELEKPLNTKIATKEYSVTERSKQIRHLLVKKKRVYFEELFTNFKKDYVVVTFLSILVMAKRQEIKIDQENNFSKIMLCLR